MTDQEKRIRDLTKSLIQISNEILAFIELMDRTMKEPLSVEKGKKIAGYLNALDQCNDSVRYFVLGVDFRTDNKKPLTYKLPKQGKKICQ